jgi:sRNA-binding carbon storage regulator CsrA
MSSDKQNRLILTRKPGQRVRIEIDGVEGWVTIVEQRTHSVRVAFEFPRCVTITREEVEPESD